MFIHKKEPSESGRKIDYSCRFKKALTLFARCECDFKNSLEGRKRKKIRNPPRFVLLLLAQPIIMLVNGVGRCGWGYADVFMRVPPARSVVKMELDSSPHPGGLKGQGIKSVTAACGLEARCRIENRSITTSCFCAMHHFSKYYVMLEFNLHSLVLNFHCEGSVYSLMLSIYYPAIAKYHSKLLILLMPGGENLHGGTWN